ncbi:methionyl-tRNA formyltransferase [Hymenobacter agri]
MQDSPKRNIVFMGGRILGYRCLEVLARYREHFNVHFVMGLRRDGVEGSDWNPSVLEQARRLGFETLDVPSLKAPEVVALFAERNIDTILNVFCDRIVPKALVDLPGMEIINFHYGHLPQYQGRFVVTHILLNDEKKTCVTTHYIDEGVDTGDIIFEDWLPVLPTDTARTLYMRCVDAGVVAFERTLDYFVRQEPLPRRPQEGTGSYFKFEEPNGLRVELEWPQEKIERFIRATTFEPISQPWIQIGDRRYDVVAQPAAPANPA